MNEDRTIEAKVHLVLVIAILTMYLTAVWFFGEADNDKPQHDYAIGKMLMSQQSRPVGYQGENGR